MKLHGKIALKVSAILKNYIWLHSFLKKAYCKLNYIIYADKKFVYNIRNGLLEKIALDEKRDFFFGYYHNTPWSYDDKFIILNSVIDSKTLNVNVWDVEKSKLITIGDTLLWNFQQGPMAGWIPGEHIVYYNKLVDNNCKTVLFDLMSNSETIFSNPIQTIHPNGTEYLSLNYDRLNLVNVDYGYSSIPKDSPNKENGIWICAFNNETKPQLVVSIDSLNSFGISSENDCNKELNHCLYSDSGDYFLFIYRYVNNKQKFSKLILVDLNSSKVQLKCINSSFVSHMCWIDNNNIFYFGDSINREKGYYKYNILNSKTTKLMSDNLVDGHPSINPNKKWIILDTYPDKRSNSYLYLYNLETTKIILVGEFKSNINLFGYNRCDLHPRWNSKGNKIMIDSSCFNNRKPLIINLSGVLDEKK